MKLAIIHTTPSTIEPLKTLAEELLPGTALTNLMDDSIIPQIAQSSGSLGQVEKRLVQYARFAEELGANASLNACSSVGEVVSTVQREVSCPVVRIDEAMAGEAVRCGKRIGVAATVETTLKLTLELLAQKAKQENKDVTLEPCCVDGAFERISAGDREGHNTLESGALSELIDKVDVVVLAQASMTQVVSSLPEEQQGKVLSSPRLGMERVKQILLENRQEA